LRENFELKIYPKFNLDLLILLKRIKLVWAIRT